MEKGNKYCMSVDSFVQPDSYFKSTETLIVLVSSGRILNHMESALAVSFLILVIIEIASPEDSEIKYVTKQAIK